MLTKITEKIQLSARRVTSAAPLCLIPGCCIRGSNPTVHLVLVRSMTLLRKRVFSLAFCLSPLDVPVVVMMYRKLAHWWRSYCLRKARGEPREVARNRLRVTEDDKEALSRVQRRTVLYVVVF